VLFLLVSSMAVKVLFWDFDFAKMILLR